MSVRILALGAIAICVLAACETAEGYRQQMVSWQGKSSDELLVQWGPPASKSTMSDGKELWQYQKETTTETAGYYQDQTRQVTRTVSDKDGKSHQETISETYPVWQPPTTTHSNCSTRFVVNKMHLVEQFTFDGSACVAPEQKASTPAS
jgi:hypothetical protein